MSQCKEEMGKIVTRIGEVTELFYQQKQKEGLDAFSPLLGEITEGIGLVFAYKQEHPDFVFEEEKVLGVLKEAMEAMEERDLILVADILQYDFVDYIEEIMETME